MVVGIMAVAAFFTLLVAGWRYMPCVNRRSPDGYKESDMTDRPHLVMICPACGGTGAVANVALHQARELARYFQVTLLSDSFPTTGLEGVTFQSLHPPRFGWLRRFGHVPRELAFALSAKSAIHRLHMRGGVGVVLCHGHPVTALAAGPLRRRLGIPCVMVTHGDIFDRPRGTYDPRLTWFYRSVTPPAYRSADLVIALSPHMASLASRGGAMPERVVVIPNGIDPAEIGLDERAAPPPRVPSDRLELLYVGRLSVEKGVDVLIAAAGLLKADGVAFRLRLVGGGPEEERLLAQVAQLQLDRDVAFLGPVSRMSLGPLYQSADLVCVPSRSETLPTVALEAMTAGVAVVGSAVGGIPSVIEEGVSGLLVPSETPQALAAALQRFGRDPALMRCMGEAGQRRIVREFTWPDIGATLAREIGRISRTRPGA